MTALNRIVGFAISTGLPETSVVKQASALHNALVHFPWLKYLSFSFGQSQLEVWGHGDLPDCIHHLEDGSLLAVVGSTSDNVSWSKLEEQLRGINNPENLELPWDGRVILIKINADGRHWTIWSDWIGSIPIFHAKIGGGRIASTLEPVVVAAAGYTSNDFFQPGLVSLLINGHYLGDWTLFKDMKLVRPDCVAEWDDQGFRWKRLWTVKPSDKRWDRGSDELMDEMYMLSRQAIAKVLSTRSSWVLPLSGGLDSRLIAAVGADMAVDIYAYTYGPPKWPDTIYAHQVARTLRLPWKRVDLGVDYLKKYTRMWADWFGSGMHFHGMYQMPFLEFLESEKPGSILQGYMGDPLAGNHVRSLIATHMNSDGCVPLTNRWVHWTAEQVQGLFKFPIDEAIGQVAAKIEEEISAVEGALYQRLMFLDFWNRQRMFIYYQPTMYDYWRGVATPFFNVEYARFCLSLPLLALEDRRLQREMLRSFYPKLASIPGTYAPRPLTLTGRYLLKLGIARCLPKALCFGPLREFNPTPNTLEPDCMRAARELSLWPIYEVWERLSEWLNMNMVRDAITAATRGDLQAVNKLEAVQTLAYRLGDETSG